MPKLKKISNDFKKSVGKAEKGFKDISEKASDSVKTFELNKEINKQEEKLQKQKFKIGEKALSLAAKGTKFDTELMKTIKNAEDIQAKIKNIKATIKKLKND